jgi:hypothetical protein
MPLKLRPSGLRFGIDKDRPAYTSTQALERRPLGGPGSEHRAALLRGKT